MDGSAYLFGVALGVAAVLVAFEIWEKSFGAILFDWAVAGRGWRLAAGVAATMVGVTALAWGILLAAWMFWSAMRGGPWWKA